MRSETENRVLISICHGFLYGNWSSSVTPITVSIHKLNHEKDNSSTLHCINLCRWLYQNQQVTIIICTVIYILPKALKINTGVITGIYQLNTIIFRYVFQRSISQFRILLHCMTGTVVVKMLSSSQSTSLPPFGWDSPTLA